MSISIFSKFLRGFHPHSTAAATPLQKAGELRQHAALWRNTVRWNQYAVSEGLKTNVDFQKKIESLYIDVKETSSLAISTFEKTDDLSDMEAIVIRLDVSESSVQNPKREKGKEKVTDTESTVSTSSGNNVSEDDDLCGEKVAEFPEDEIAENTEALAKKLNRWFNPFYKEPLCLELSIDEASSIDESKDTELTDSPSSFSSSTSTGTSTFFHDPLWVKDENLYYESNKPAGY